MSQLLQKQKDLWNRLAEYGAERSVLDPNDRSGKKNAYIRYTVTKMLAKEFGCPDHASVLVDFGCGSGRNSRHLLDIGYSIIGIDISSELLNYTVEHRKSNDLFVLYNGESLPVLDNSIDGGFTNGVLICIIDDQVVGKILSQLYGAVKPGGRMVFVEQVRRSRRMLNCGTKLQRTHNDYLKLLSSAGFIVTADDVIRRGHFPFIYLIRYNLLPSFCLPWVASLESRIGKYFKKPLFDYAVTAFVCEKPLQ